MTENKKNLAKIVRKSVEEVWYDRRSFNPIEDQTTTLIEQLSTLIDNSYSQEDLKNAFEAGQALVDHEWHMEEFHTNKCTCIPPDYENFDEWFSKLKNENK